MPQAMTPSQEEIFSQSEWSEISTQLALSLRQNQVLYSLFAGHSDKQIASDLQISIPTVRTHLTRLFQKFAVNDREELILHIVSYFRSTCRELDCPRKQ